MCAEQSRGQADDVDHQEPAHAAGPGSLEARLEQQVADPGELGGDAVGEPCSVGRAARSGSTCQV